MYPILFPQICYNMFMELQCHPPLKTFYSLTHHTMAQFGLETTISQIHLKYIITTIFTKASQVYHQESDKLWLNTSKIVIFSRCAGARQIIACEQALFRGNTQEPQPWALVSKASCESMVCKAAHFACWNLQLYHSHIAPKIACWVAG